MMNKAIAYILILTLNITIINAQARLQPKPKFIEFGNEEISLSVVAITESSHKNLIEKKAANYFNFLLKNKFGELKRNSEKTIDDTNWSVLIKNIKNEESFPNTQYYKIEVDKIAKTINLQSPSQLGLLYGVVTLVDLMFEKEREIKINEIFVEDFPTYQRRLFVADPKAKDIPNLFNWALRNKLETIVLASRRHPWFEVSEEYLSILKEIKKWRNLYGGPEVMQSHNIYEGKNIVISDSNDINSLKNVIKKSYEFGIKKLMILSDDTPPYKFGDGYILTNEKDKAMFDHFEAANTYLMNELVNWFNNENMEIEPYYVPAFYTYEEMHQGDMTLYKNTPWEKDAYEPLYRDLGYLGKHLNKEVYIIWCGPFVRSREISSTDLTDWTKNLNGRVPFLWDNTIYSHYPYTSTSFLTSWDNILPENFDKITAGNGMFINNDANSETGMVGSITTNDYLWNPTSYNPEKSLKVAITREYGFEFVDMILEFKEIELNIRKNLGERKLWFQTDTLWQQIRKVRLITDKNPFYFHLNYSRLKALRLQLKASIPEPESKKIFFEKLLTFDKRRNDILDKIKNYSENVYMRLKDNIAPIPNFNLIQ